MRPGDIVTSTVTYAAPHHLVADAPITSHRPWAAPGSSGGTGKTGTDHAGTGSRPQPLLSIGAPPAR